MAAHEHDKWEAIGKLNDENHHAQWHSSRPRKRWEVGVAKESGSKVLEENSKGQEEVEARTQFVSTI